MRKLGFCKTPMRRRLSLRERARVRGNWDKAYLPELQFSPRIPSPRPSPGGRGGLRPRGRGRKGGAVVEAAMILPLLLMFYFGILEYSRWLMTVQLVHNAVSQGAEYAAKHTDPTIVGGTTYGNANSNVLAVITARLAGYSLQSQNIQIYQSDALGNNLGVWTARRPGSTSAYRSPATTRSCNQRCSVLPPICLFRSSPSRQAKGTKAHGHRRQGPPLPPGEGWSEGRGFWILAWNPKSAIQNPKSKIQNGTRPGSEAVATARGGAAWWFCCLRFRW